MSKKMCIGLFFAAILAVVSIPVFAGDYISINPLGFVQFGPTLEYSFFVSPKIEVVAMFRLHGAGLVSYLLNDALTVASFAFGGGIRYFFANKTNQDSFYLGGQGQFGFGHSASEDGTGLWEGDFTYMVFMTEVGYRWYGDGMFLAFGAQAGIASELSDVWWYLSTPTVKNNDILETYFIGMLVLSIGFEL